MDRFWKKLRHGESQKEKIRDGEDQKGRKSEERRCRCTKSQASRKTFCVFDCFVAPEGRRVEKYIYIYIHTYIYIYIYIYAMLKNATKYKVKEYNRL